MPTTVCRATGRGWAAFTRRSRAAGIECFAGGVNVALRGSGSTRCWLASRFLLPESLTRARSLWPASGNLREEPSAGKPLARICGGESRMAELPDRHHNPFSEAQFKTLKYRPDFPERFGAIQDARA